MKEEGADNTTAIALPLRLGGTIVRGKPKNPVGLHHGDDVIRLKTCPDCDGRGWYLIEPFRTGGANGCGGTGNLCQCETCKNSLAYWDKHGCLPPEVKEAIEKKKAATAELANA